MIFPNLQRRLRASCLLHRRPQLELQLRPNGSRPVQHPVGCSPTFPVLQPTWPTPTFRPTASKVLKDAGYATGWFNSFKAAYHNKKLFGAHGTDHFFDETYYKAHGITEKIGSWGLADKPVLKQTAQGPADFAAAEHHFAMTISTHARDSGADVPASLLEELGANSTYHGLLSSYRYLDEAIEGFFESFCGSSGGQYAIVLLGDHGTPHRPPDVETNIQHRESRFRFRLRSSPKTPPQKLSHVVHQIDVAPTIARIVGIRPDVTWMGRGSSPSPKSVVFTEW